MEIIAHKIALDPNDVQATLMRQHCGAARVAFNWARDRYMRGIGEGEFLSDRSIRPEFNAVKREAYPWMAGVSANAAKNAIIHFGAAARRWQDYKRAKKAGKAGRKVGFPKRRTIKRGGYRYQADNGPGTIKAVDGRLRLPYVGDVRMREQPRFDGEIRAVYISETAGQWFASLTFAAEDKAPAREIGETLGVDMGIKTLAHLSDGARYESPKPLRAMLARLARLNRRLARQTRFSYRWRKTKARVARLHARIANIRLDHAHRSTTEIANRRGLGAVKVETLNIRGMMRNRRMARAMADVGISQWLRLLAYKCARRGIRVVKVDRWYPSSQLCNGCGWRNRTLTLAMRDWRCGGCGAVNDRDLNAAKNIRDYDAASSAESLNGRRVDAKAALSVVVDGGPIPISRLTMDLGI